MMSKYTLRVCGIPILSFERQVDEEEIEYISNLGGEFGFAEPDEEEYEEYEEEDSGFGFRSPPWA